MKLVPWKVKCAMERAHMTVNDLAHEIGLPPQNTAAVINGMNAAPATLQRIARALYVAPSDIIRGHSRKYAQG